MKPWGKWISLKLRYKIFSGIFVIILFMFLGGFLVLRNERFQNYIKFRIISYLEKNIDARITIREITGNPFSYIRLKGIVLHGPFKTISPENHLLAKEMVARFNLLKMLRGEIEFSSVRVIQPSIYLDVNSFLLKSDKKETARLTNFELGWIQLIDGEVLIKYSNNQYESVIDNLSGSFSILEGKTDIRVRNFSGVLEGLKIDKLRGQLSLSQKGIDFESIQISGQDIDVNLEGQIENVNPPMVKLNLFSSKLPIDKISKMIPSLEKTTISGMSNFRLDLTGPLDKMTGRGQFSTSKGTFNSVSFNQLKLDFTMETSYFKLQELSLNILNGKIIIVGGGHFQFYDVPFTKSDSSFSSDPEVHPKSRTGKLAIDGNLIGKFENLNVREIPTIDTSLFGVLTGDFNISGNLLDLSSLKGGGYLILDHGKFKDIDHLQFTADLQINGNSLRFSNAKFSTPEGIAEGNILVTIPGKLEFHVNWNSTNISRHASIVNLKNISGAGKGDVHGYKQGMKPLTIEGKFQLVSGQWEEIQFSQVDGIIRQDRTLELHGTKLIWRKEWPVDKAVVKIQIGEVRTKNAKKLVFSEIEIINGKSHAIAMGQVDLSTRQIDFSYQSQEVYLLDLPAVQENINWITTIKPLNLSGTIKGKFDDITITSRFNAISYKVFNTSLSDNLYGSLTIHNNQIQFSVYAAGYESSGLIDYQHADPDIRISSNLKNAILILPGEKLNNTNLKGNVTGSVLIHGRYSNLSFFADISNAYLQINTTNEFSLNFDFGSGILQGQFQNSLQNGQLVWQTSLSERSLTGLKLPEVFLKMNWLNYKDLMVEFTSTKGVLRTTPVKNISGKIELKDDYLSGWGQFGLPSNPYSKFFGRVSYIRKDQKALYTINMNLNSIPLDTFSEFGNKHTKYHLLGDVSGEVSLSGLQLKWAEMDGFAKLSLENISYERYRSKLLVSTIYFKRGRIELTDSYLDLENSRINLNGWFGFNKDFDLHIKGVIPEFGHIIEKTSGKGVIDLHITQSVDNPKVDGNIQIDQGNYQFFSWQSALIRVNFDNTTNGNLEGVFKQFQIGQQSFDIATVNVKVRDNKIIADDLILIFGKSISRIQGEINTKTGDIKGNISGNNLMISRWLSKPSSGWLVDFLADFEAQLSGNYKMQNGLITFTKLIGRSGNSIIESESPIQFEWQREQLTVHPFTIYSRLVNEKNYPSNQKSLLNSKGILECQGQITLNNLEPKSYNITLTGHNFSWPFIKGIEADYNPELRLIGSSQEPKLSGIIKFNQITISPEIFQSKQFNPINSGRVISFPSIKLQMDLTLSAESSIYFHGDLLDLEAGGWIKINSSLTDEITVTYELKTIKGFVIYRNRKFPISKAELRHSDPEVFNPYIEAMAQTRVRSIEIFLRVVGTMNNYDILLSSDPPYSQSDIFALLATGRTNEELRLGASRQLMSEVAVGYASQQIINTLGSPVIKTVGIDQVNIEYDEVDNETKLIVEKDLLKNLSVGYSIGFSKESNSSAQVDYKIKNNLSIIGRIGVNNLNQEAGGSLDLEWRIPTK